MKAESRQIPQKLAARLKFVYCTEIYQLAFMNDKQEYFYQEALGYAKFFILSPNMPVGYTVCFTPLIVWEQNQDSTQIEQSFSRSFSKILHLSVLSFSLRQHLL